MARHQANAQREGRSIVALDESGFYLLGCTSSSYAPVGQTPVLRCVCSRDHLSCIGAITLEGRLLMQTYEHSIKSEQVVEFLAHLHRHIPGKLLVVLDGSQIHKSQAVKDFLAQAASHWLKLERLPAYAPELNPQEYVWRYLKHVEMANLCCADVEALKREHRQAKERLRHKTDILQAAFTHAGLV